MVCTHIASKIEDVKPIPLGRLKEEAGHNKFKLKWIRERELEIMKTLNFKLMRETVYEVAMRYLKTHLNSMSIKLP
jgi:hypothetical protein